MTGNTLRRHAEAAAPWPDIAVFLSVRSNDRLELAMTTPQRCSAGGEPGTVAVEYESVDGAIRRSTHR